MDASAILYDIFVSLLLLVDLGLVLLSAGIFDGTKGKRGTAEVMDTGPKTLVMIPCRGRDITLKENIASAMHQSYRDYDAVAIVDSMDDESIPVLRDSGIGIMVSDGDDGKGSGKVRAIATALEEKKGYGIYVILDSDVHVDKKWLSELVAPLSDKDTGISTTFPYFRPMKGFWSRMKTVWGFVGLGLMESERTRFGWGGSLAFRRELVDGKSEMSYFKSMISDDIAITRIAKAKGLGIGYCRKAGATVNCEESFASLWEWSNRQAALSIAGNRKVLHYGLTFYAANILLFLSGIALALLYTPFFLVLLAPYAIGLAKAYQRSRDASAGTLVAFTLSPFMYMANLIVASRMKSITWRGREYDISGESSRRYGTA